MNLIEALKTGLPLRLKGATLRMRPSPQYGAGITYISPTTFIAPQVLVESVDLSLSEILSENWEIKESPLQN